MKIKVDGKIYNVVKIVVDDSEKAHYFFVEGQKTPFGDLDYDIEIIEIPKYARWKHLVGEIEKVGKVYDDFSRMEELCFMEKTDYGYFAYPYCSKTSNKKTDLISTGDLLIIEDRVRNATFPIIYDEEKPFAFDSAIFELKEWYVKVGDDYKKYGII